MFGSLNKVQLIGSLGADPEIKSFQNGGRVANLRVACSESWKDKNTGERKEKTEWVNVAVFSDGLVGLVERFLRKGNRIYVEGKFQTRKWQDQSGNDRYTTEVVIQGYGGTLIKLDKKDEGGQQQGGGSGSGDRGRDSAQSGGAGITSEQRLGGGHSSSSWGSSGSGSSFADDLDDDIPF